MLGMQMVDNHVLGSYIELMPLHYGIAMEQNSRLLLILKPYAEYPLDGYRIICYLWNLNVHGSAVFRKDPKEGDYKIRHQHLHIKELGIDTDDHVVKVISYINSILTYHGGPAKPPF